MKVTNNSKAPQGVRTAVGVVFLLPGQTREVELTEDGHTQAARLRFLEVSGNAPKADGGEPGTDKDVLLTKLKALGIDIGPNAKVETLQKRLAEAEGKAKADAIAQLKEKGIQVGDEVTLEDLQAELAKHQ